MIQRSKLYGDHQVPFLIGYCVCSILIISLNLRNNSKLSQRGCFIVLIIIFVSIVDVVVPGYNIIKGLFKWSIPISLSVFMFATYDDMCSIWKKYVIIITIIAAISLFFYVLGTALHLISPTGIFEYFYDEKIKSCNAYYNIYFEAQEAQFSVGSISQRNTGIFVEAPYYNYMLCLAYAFEMYIKSEKHLLKISILLFAILSTFSTTGIFFLLTMFVLKIYLGIENGVINKKQAQIIKIIVTVLAGFMGLYIAFKIVNKKLASITGAASYSVRLDHMMTFFRMWVKKPLFGQGYLNTEMFYKMTQFQKGNSVGLPAILGYSGIVMLMVYLIPLARNVYSSLYHKDRGMYIWIGIFIISFMTAMVFQLPFIIALSWQIVFCINNSPYREKKELSDIPYWSI